MSKHLIPKGEGDYWWECPSHWERVERTATGKPPKCGITEQIFECSKCKADVPLYEVVDGRHAPTLYECGGEVEFVLAVCNKRMRRINKPPGYW